MKEVAFCKYTNIDREFSLEDLAAFHGHLGPYLVLGYRIGRYARSYISEDPFELGVKVYCSGTPPESCIVDGLQIGSGCTYGKRNIEIKVNDLLKCDFIAGGKHIAIVPRPIEFPPEDCDGHEKKIEELAEKMYGMSDIDLFKVIPVNAE